MGEWIKRVIVIGILVVGVDVGRYFFTPDIAELKVKHPVPTAFMTYWEEQNRAKGGIGQLRQEWVSLKQISPFLIKAVLISEDDKFWKHDGFDAKGLEEAFERNIKAGKLAAGGSTISQQLAKNIYLSPSKNPIRKIKEAILTYRIEQTLTKREILELYLNCAQWGDGIFGIEAAAGYYYHKRAKNLTPFEAARLASVLPNPVIYNPLGNQPFVVKKAAVITKIMGRRGLIVESFETVMKEKPLAVTPQEEINEFNSTLNNPIEENTTQTETQKDTNAS